MARRGDARSRSEIQDQVETQEQDREQKGEDSELVTVDAETIGQTKDELEGGGTIEGTESAVESVDAAQDVTAEEHERQDEQIEEVQAEIETHEQELQERSDTDQADLGKLSDATSELKTDVATGELIDAKEALIEDDEFLQDQKRQAEEGRQESERIQQEHRSRVNRARR